MTYLSPKYIDSSSIFAIYSLILLFRINDYEDIFIVSKNAKIMLYIYITAFLINVILNYFLILRFGAEGAAISTLISIFFIASSSMVLSSRIINKAFYDFFDINALAKTFIILSISFLIVYIFFISR